MKTPCGTANGLYHARRRNRRLATWAPGNYYSDGVVVRSGCLDGNRNIVPIANVVTKTDNRKLYVNFKSSGTLYKLLMTPFSLSGGFPTGAVSA